MYPEQDESEVASSLRDLGDKSRSTIALLQTRLGNINSDDKIAERDQLKSFLQKWLERLDKETESWEERRLSLSGLKNALP
jgi:hypothetical protein